MALAVGQIRFSFQAVALIKNGDGHINAVLISKYNSKYFTCKHGTFELDGNYEYYFYKTPIYFYNFANTKPISLEAMDEITTHLFAEKLTYLQNTERLQDIIGANPQIKVEDISFSKNPKFAISTNTFLSNFQTEDEVNNTVLLLELNDRRKPIPRYSMSLIPTISFANLAIVRIGKRQIDIVKGKILGDKMLTKYGVLNIRKETQCRSGKQRIFIFNLFKDDANATVTKKLKRKELRALKKQFNKKDFEKIEDSKIYSLSIATETLLPQHVAENPLSNMVEKKVIHKAGVAVHTKLSDPMRKAFPILLAMIGVMGLVIVVANAGTVLNEFAEIFQLGKYNPRNQIQPQPQATITTPAPTPQPTPTPQTDQTPPPLFNNKKPVKEEKPINPNIPSLPIPKITLPTQTPKNYTVILGK